MRVRFLSLLESILLPQTPEGLKSYYIWDSICLMNAFHPQMLEVLQYHVEICTFLMLKSGLLYWILSKLETMVVVLYRQIWKPVLIFQNSVQSKTLNGLYPRNKRNFCKCAFHISCIYSFICRYIHYSHVHSVSKYLLSLYYMLDNGPGLGIKLGTRGAQSLPWCYIQAPGREVVKK